MTEADFTPPTDWCPHPQDWTSDDDQATEHEVTELVAAFVRALQPRLVIETGSNSGQTAEAIGNALLLNGADGRLVTCEIDPQMIGATKVRCRDLPVTVFEGKGVDYIPEQGVDMLWLDSDANARHLEFEHYRPHLNAGAVIGVHDTAPHHPVHNHFAPYGLTGLRLRTPRGVSFYQSE